VIDKIIALCEAALAAIFAYTAVFHKVDPWVVFAAGWFAGRTLHRISQGTWK
jgi:hypothetical protein